MAHVKAATLIYLRTKTRAMGGDAEKQLLAGLTPADVKLYNTALSTSWIPMDLAARLYPVGAAILFPGDPRCLQRLGAAVAKDNFTTVYKVLLRLATIPFPISQTAKVWRTYHQQGVLRVEHGDGTKEASLHLAEYPDLLPPVADCMTGYIVGLSELSGARNTSADVESLGGGKFRWTVRWE